MKKIALGAVAVSVCLLAGTSQLLGATIPAGTILVVRSLQSVTSVDVV